jgi:hypothetical protein
VEGRCDSSKSIDDAMARTSRSSRTDTIAVSDEAALTASTRSTSPAVSKKRPLETDAAPSARLAKRAKASTSSSVRPKRSKAKAEPIGTPSLVEEWRELSCKTLPAAAQAKDDAQSKWPVWVDHCFSRMCAQPAAIVSICLTLEQNPRPRGRQDATVDGRAQSACV